MSGFAVRRHSPQTLLSFEDGLARLKGKKQEKLENNTYLVKVDDDTLGVKLHNTIVVYIYKSGIYQYDTGGWQTNTTKDRINRYGPASVFSDNGIWHVGNGIYEDGVRLDSKGNVLTAQRGVKETESKKRKLDRMVRKYIKGFGAHVIRNGLQLMESRFSEKPTEQSPWKVVELVEGPNPIAPGPGDCWSCYFGITSDEPDKEPLGVGHLVDHFRENYFVPSLLWKAILVGGYQNPGFIWQHIASDASRGDSKFLDSVLTAYFRKRKVSMLNSIE